MQGEGQSRPHGVLTMKLDLEHADRAAQVRDGARKVPCVIVGHFLEGRYVRVRLLEQHGCHLAGDLVDYGSQHVEYLSV